MFNRIRDKRRREAEKTVEGQAALRLEQAERRLQTKPWKDLLNSLSEEQIYDGFIADCRLLAKNPGTPLRDKAAARCIVTLSEPPYGKEYVEGFLGRAMSGHSEKLNPHEKHVVSHTLSELDQADENNLMTRRKFGKVGAYGGGIFVALATIMNLYGFKAINSIPESARLKQIDNMVTQIEQNPSGELTPEGRVEYCKLIDKHFARNLAPPLENRFPWASLISGVGGAVVMFYGISHMNEVNGAREALIAAAAAYAIDKVGDTLEATAKRELGGQWTEELAKRQLERSDPAATLPVTR